MASGSLCKYQREEVKGHANENNEAANYRINKNKITTSKYIEVKNDNNNNNNDNNNNNNNM